jgi:hypothetical protein
MAKKGRAWKMERTVVHKKGGGTRSNRYSDSDFEKKPPPGSRKQYWHPSNNRYQKNPHCIGPTARNTCCRCSSRRGPTTTARGEPLSTSEHG